MTRRNYYQRKIDQRKRRFRERAGVRLMKAGGVSLVGTIPFVISPGYAGVALGLGTVGVVLLIVGYRILKGA